MNIMSVQLLYIICSLVSFTQRGQPIYLLYREIIPLKNYRHYYFALSAANTISQA